MGPGWTPPRAVESCKEIRNGTPAGGKQHLGKSRRTGRGAGELYCPGKSHTLRAERASESSETLFKTQAQPLIVWI